VERDPLARDNWEAAGIPSLLAHSDRPFADTRLLITCEEDDEFGFAAACELPAVTLREHGIDHTLELFSDSQAKRISPHSLGIAGKLLRGMRFVLEGGALRNGVLADV
jgi:hypothetical protein